MFSSDPKPLLWAFDPGAVDPQWWDFWGSCVACVPAWENLSGQNPPMILGSSVSTSNAYRPRFCKAIALPDWSIVRDGPSVTDSATGNTTWAIPPDFLASPQDIFPTDSLTLLFVRKKRSTSIASTNSFGLGVQGSPGATERCGGHVPYSDGTVYWDFGGTAGANRLTWSGYVVSTEIEKWAFIAGKQGSAIYFNGNKVASQSTAITRTKITSSVNYDFGLARGNAVTTGNQVDISFFAALNVEWTAGQVSEWAEDPYGPIRMMIDISSAAIIATLGTQSVLFM